MTADRKRAPTGSHVEVDVAHHKIHAYLVWQESVLSMHLQHSVSAGATSGELISRGSRPSILCWTPMQHCLPTRRPFTQTRSGYRSLTGSVGNIHGASCCCRCCNNLRVLLHIYKGPRSQEYNDDRHLRKLLLTCRVIAVIFSTRQREHREWQ